MKNIVELIKLNAQYVPDQLALVDEEKTLTYKELFEKVIKKASLIKELGIFHSPILVKVNRLLDSLVNFFAILLSNNYYVPVDEDIPFEKLAKIIKSANIKHYISFKEDKLPLIKIKDETPKRIFNFEEFALDFDEDNYSYLMFTSGSTGEPKGVIKNHKNIISFVNNFVNTFSFLGQERIANQTPFFFDASMKDIFLTLKLAATLYIPNKTRFALPGETIKYLNENKITYVCWVPSILTMIAKTRTLSFVKPESLKYVFFVGEVFQPKYLSMWLLAMPMVRYFNIYGSTEVMGVSLFYEVEKNFNKEAVPTGKPLKNNKVYLKDNEIIIESDQVAVGYLNIPESKTFEVVDGHKLLHTGDYASYDEDGNIVFNSRKDFQIKHLGYRIELQEIEANLINLEYIDNCCAIYDEMSDKIILFASLNKDIEDANKTIIGDSKRLLQFYMVPNKVIILKELPYNINGKIDRQDLKRGYQNGRY